MPPRRDVTNRKSTNRRTTGGGSKRSKTLDEYYEGIYKDRWPALRAAMVQPPAKVALWNRFCQLPKEQALRGLERVSEAGLSELYRPIVKDGGGGGAGTVMEKPPVDDFKVRAYYLLDYASALIVEQLQVGAFDYVLDVCAAPGGKSVAICQFLSPDGSLTSNEAKGDRVARLRRTLTEHVPPNFVSWKVTQRDAQTWHHPDGYTRVLVDAPCSSERHLLHQAGGGAVDVRDFTPESSAALAEVQRGILLRAIETCRPGGRIVYSTCSISPLENDGVVAAVLQRTRCGVRVERPARPAEGAEVRNVLLDLAEPTELGHLLLPDTAEGWGPMYCCVLHKVSNERLPDSESEDDDEEGEDESGDEEDNANDD